MVERKQRNTVVISHWDLDGLASATMLTEYYKPLRTILSSITALPRNMLQGIKTLDRNGLIVISDLNPQVKHVKDLKEILRLCRERNISVKWIDHHLWDRVIYRLFSEYSDVLTYIDDTSTVAADLVAKLYGFTDNIFYNRLVELAIDDDFFLNRYELTIIWRRMLRWYKWGLRYRALESFLKHEINPPWLMKMYESEVKTIYENLIREAIGRSDIIHTRNGFRVVVFQDVDPRIHPGEVTWIAKTHGLLADIYIVRYPRGVSLRSDKVDVSMIAKLLGGGGHSNAAGIPGRIDIDSILSIISNINLRGRYGDRIIA